MHATARRLIVVLLACVAVGAQAATLRIDTYALMAPGVAPAALRVRVLLPPGYRANDARPTLYVDDGQDAEAVHLADALAGIARINPAGAPVVVAVDTPPDRMGAYGFSDRATGRSVIAPTRYGDVGARAQAYTQWLTGTLLPFVQARYAVRRDAASRALLGWSLGGAHAFNTGWQYPEVFGRIGAFSPSFWLARDRTDARSVERTRIAQGMVDADAVRRDLRLFIAIGTDEETDDRDGDGINDALDDVRDLVDGWRSGDEARAGLAQAGYRIDRDGEHANPDSDAVLYVLDGGTHNQASWARMLPAFLHWAYGPPTVK